MKKILLLSATALIVIASVNAQSTSSLQSEIKTDNRVEKNIKKEKREDRKELRKLEGKNVSIQSKAAFNEDFGNVSGVTWERTTNFDEATFTKEGKIMKAYYDSDSKLVGTSTHKTVADLPAAAQKHIAQKYQGYSKQDVIFFDDNEYNETDMIMYDTQFDDADNYFVELRKGDKIIILQVGMNGDVSFFKKVR